MQQGKQNKGIFMEMKITNACQFILDHENKRLGAIQARKTDPRYYKPEQCVTSTVEHNVS